MKQLPEITFTPEEMKKIKRRQEEFKTLEIQLDEDLYWRGDINTDDSTIIHESLILLKHVAPSVELSEDELQELIQEERDFKRAQYQSCEKAVERLEQEVLGISEETVKLFNQYEGNLKEIDKLYPDEPAKYWNAVDYPYVLANYKQAKFNLMCKEGVYV